MQKFNNTKAFTKVSETYTEQACTAIPTHNYARWWSGYEGPNSDIDDDIKLLISKTQLHESLEMRLIP
jgi:hypothetical protein